jgi:hypothetical protein
MAGEDQGAEVPTVVDDPGRRARRVPDEWSTESCYGHSRTTPQASRPGLAHVSQVAEETR